MTKQFDYKKEWEKTKRQLAKFSKEATEIAKKGEKELVKFSKKGKLHVDSTSVSLKKEHLYYLIGKEYCGLKNPEVPSAKLKKYLAEVKKADREQKQLKKKIVNFDK